MNFEGISEFLFDNMMSSIKINEYPTFKVQLILQN